MGFAFEALVTLFARILIASKMRRHAFAFNGSRLPLPRDHH